MLIGSTEYFVIIWAVLIVWGLAIAALVAGGLLKRRWILLAIAGGIAVGGILLSRALLYTVSS